MARIAADPVEVRSSHGRPEYFLWRDRLYAVRGVLDHWKESGAWWRDLAGARPATPADQPAADPGAPLAHGTAPEAPAPIDRTEREVWRVEASPGRYATPGVYDLSLDPARGRWTLTRTAD
ncbi:DUF6504 family protein [Allostreptomyces psammosilenae]|uniref:DUF6504 domain-containing protein n=1 Tax=Allostreptomyces psammosilenae TaxID=1892865 RepID=A0A853A9J9_9ACTN|nr:DUF6504 family protein [Allostreptomyces psammosilenae]NYI07082.1 hypothetical protein [Allostreptomyces psammosilenae]